MHFETSDGGNPWIQFISVFREIRGFS